MRVQCIVLCNVHPMHGRRLWKSIIKQSVKSIQTISIISSRVACESPASASDCTHTTHVHTKPIAHLRVFCALSFSFLSYCLEHSITFNALENALLHPLTKRDYLTDSGPSIAPTLSNTHGMPNEHYTERTNINNQLRLWRLTYICCREGEPNKSG